MKRIWQRVKKFISKPTQEYRRRKKTAKPKPVENETFELDIEPDVQEDWNNMQTEIKGIIVI